MLRQKPDTPVRKSLAKAVRAVKRLRFLPRKTWYSLIEKDFEGLEIKIEDESIWVKILDHSQWKRRFSQAMSS